jgi:hypothetical protein
MGIFLIRWDTIRFLMTLNHTYSASILDGMLTSGQAESIHTLRTLSSQTLLSLKTGFIWCTEVIQREVRQSWNFIDETIVGCSSTFALMHYNNQLTQPHF